MKRVAVGREQDEQFIDNPTINCSYMKYLTVSLLTGLYTLYLLILQTTVVIPNLRAAHWVRNVLLCG